MLLIITNKNIFIWDEKIKDSLCCSDHDMVELRIPGAVRKVKSKLMPKKLQKSLMR